MKTITIDEQKLALQLFRWIVPTINEWPIDWLSFEKEDELNRYYKYENNRIVHAIWINAQGLTEVHFKRIYKKINLLPHEFFLYHYGKVTRLGWRMKNVTK